MAGVHLSRVQTLLNEALQRFRYVVSGRRVGKTIWLLVECILAARKPRANIWYTAPTYTMARDIAWQPLIDMLPSGRVRKTNSSRLQVYLTNGSVISLKGVDNPQTLRGRGLDFAALDEYSFYEKNVFPEIIRPMLAVSEGRAAFGLTPKGFNHSYDTYAAIKAGKMGDDWGAWSFTTAEGGWVSPQELAAAKRELDQRMYRQEYEASFEALSGRVYSNFERSVHLDESVADDGSELLIGMDFNVNPMTYVVSQRRGAMCHVIDAVEVQTSTTQEVADDIKQRYPNRRIIVCPDPSGKNRSVVSDRTSFTILENAGFAIDASSRAPGVIDRVNVVQAMLRSADGNVGIAMHPRSLPLIKAMEGQQYKDGTSIPEKAGLDHAADAFGYLTWQQFNLLRGDWRETPVQW